MLCSDAKPSGRVTGGMPSSPCIVNGFRRNVYDGEIEYWVTVRETGKRKEETSMEVTHTKEEEADTRLQV